MLDIKVPAGTQDALGGAQALREATEQAAEQVAQWSTVQLERYYTIRATVCCFAQYGEGRCRAVN